MNGHKIANSEAIRGSVNMEVFNAYLFATMNVLGQAEQFIFVLDNVNFHHIVSPREFKFFKYNILDLTCAILNQREEAFSLIKSNLRRISPPSDTRDLISRMNDATCSVIPQHLENFIMPTKSIYGAYLNLADIGRE
ncbi:hypothetical protein RF11_03448 [Thelohanellus kitauei]|uniref:Tc1-like transposase DDE domain-containing protein n=1 Tax=Thelohanellus kitauei TaxID=669202 RepID=A0A0C2IF67_THEKT|nr:hypothetical protein RF11_03448 [Thelohanellus kitauei]